MHFLNLQDIAGQRLSKLMTDQEAQYRTQQINNKESFIRS